MKKIYSLILLGCLPFIGLSQCDVVLPDTVFGCDSVLVSVDGTISGESYCWQSALNSGTWDTLGSVGFSYPYGGRNTIIDFDEDGFLYAAYLDASGLGFGEKQVNVMKYDGTWQFVGSPGFSDPNGDASNLSFKIHENTLYVAFSDDNAVSPGSRKASVMMFDGQEWVYVGQRGFSDGGVDNVSIDFDSNGTPYVGFRDWTENYEATVMKYNGLTWEDVGTQGFTLGAAGESSIAISPDDEPYIAFSDPANGGKISVMKYNGVMWAYYGNSGFSQGGTNHIISIDFDSNGTAYVGFSDNGNSNKAVVFKNGNGLAWQQVGIDVSAGIANHVVLYIDEDGMPYVVYSDIAYNTIGGSQLGTLKKFEDPYWVSMGDFASIGYDNMFNGGGLQFCSLVVNNGVPFVGVHQPYMNTSQNNFDEATVYTFVPTCESTNSAAWINESGNQFLTVTDSTGCTATSSVYVEILPGSSTTFTQNINICAGETFTVGSNVYELDGTYYDSFTSSNGCDSLVTTVLQVDTPTTSGILGQTNIQPFASYTYVLDPTPVGYTITWSEENGTITSGQGTNVVDVFWDANGFGEVIVTLTNGTCIVTDTLLVGSNPTGILQQLLEQTKISPNPSPGIFTVNVPDQTNIQASVFDALGKLVSTSNEIGTFNLDLSDMPVGIYTLRLDTESGTVTKKLVRE